MAQGRLDALSNQLTSPKREVVICAAYRTAIGKGKRGSFKNTPPEGIMSLLLKGLVEKTRIDPNLIEDIIFGNVLLPGCGAVLMRMAQLVANIPKTTTMSCINRQCSSGIASVASIANAIKAGTIDIGIGAGVESMSMGDMSSGGVNPDQLWSPIFDHEVARNCMMPMGMTSDGLASKYGVTRQEQDQLAVSSHDKALRAQEMGLFDEEIIPITVNLKDADGNEKEVTVSKDEGPRKGTSLEGLGKLKGAFGPDGTTTAGNSSQISDGAAAVLLASREAAERHGLPIIGRFHEFVVGGCPPELMGIGPAVAIPLLFEKTGLTEEDIDIFEINEAFASQAAYCIKELNIPMSKVNPKGGAMALGHPLACTGARQVATLLPELKRQNKRFGVISM